VRLLQEGRRIEDDLSWLLLGVAGIYPWLSAINTKMEVVLSNQDELDARSARIEASNASIAAEVTELKAQVAAGTPAEALDFSRLDAAIAGEEALEPAPAADPVPAPADPAPADPAPLPETPVAAATPDSVPPVVDSPLPPFPAS